MAYTQANTNRVGKFYKHQPLDSENHQIRLLKLRNSSEHTMDYCLITFDFESAPSYVALSYTWGDECPTGSVSIDGKELEIRMNLLNFLRTYETDDYLWIDQISIDQSNSEERSHQVKMMWKIYSRCDYVLVWLQNDMTCIPSTKQAALDFNNGVQSYLKHGRREDGSSDDKKSFDWPTLALLHNPYFDRLWIVQELLLNKHFFGMKSRPNRVAFKWTLKLIVSRLWAMSQKRVKCPSISDLKRPAADGGTSLRVIDTTMTVKNGRARRNSKNILYQRMCVIPNLA
ncbi:unnamed protein product [Alternaria alternata]